MKICVRENNKNKKKNGSIEICSIKFEELMSVFNLNVFNLLEKVNKRTVGNENMNFRYLIASLSIHKYCISIYIKDANHTKGKLK